MDAIRRLDADPNNVTAWQDLGNALSGLKRYQKAIASYDKALASELKPHYIPDVMAFMFESRYVFEPTAFALSTPALDRDYDAVWNGFRKAAIPK